MKLNILTTAIASSLMMAATSAGAAMTTDHHGNVGYDSYEECVSAVKAGTAKFYTPYTHQKPKRWDGETTVKKTVLSKVKIPSDIADDMPLNTREYSAGACDLGVGQSHGRYGVSAVLVGKYVPFAPDMPVNVYMNQQGMPVRVTMQQCDNHFGDRFPTPVISELKAPKPQLAIKEDRDIQPIITKVTRVIRPARYRVKEVIVAPKEQINHVSTDEGTAVTVESADHTVYLGNQAHPEILDDVVVTQPVPIIKVPEVDQKRIYDPATGKYVIVK